MSHPSLFSRGNMPEHQLFAGAHPIDAPAPSSARQALDWDLSVVHPRKTTVPVTSAPPGQKPPISPSKTVRLRFWVTLATLLATCRYLWWRITSGVPAGYGWAFEAFAFTLLVLECLQIFGQRPFMFRTRSRSAQVDRDLDWYGRCIPRVDILIPTYNEPWPVLERTLVGAASQNYANFKIWVLDDGKRAWLEQTAGAWGVGYITRENNLDFKAGNLNNAVDTLRARGVRLEYVALLDADSIARPEFLRRAMALLRDAQVGIVQTPQRFYNPDPFQRALGVRSWPEEERWWFDMAWPAQDAVDNAQCCGTGCVIRADALQAIGGFPIGSVTEDLLCSMRMRRAGWQTVYLHEPLVLSLAAESLGAWFSQRARWLSGEVQNQRLLRAPGFLPAVSFWIRLLHLPLGALERLLWTIAHLTFWYTGYWVLGASVEDAASHLLPLWALSATWIWLSRGCLNPAVISTYATLQRFLWLRAPVQAALSREQRFVVTPKAIRREGKVIHVQLLRWHLATSVALAGGVLYNLVFSSAPAHGHAWMWANALVALFLLAQLLAAMVPMVEGPQRRRDDRYCTWEEILLKSSRGEQSVRAVNLSVGGVLLEGVAADTPSEIQLHLSAVGWVRAEFSRRGAAGTAYRFTSPEQRPMLIRKVYCSTDYVPLPEHWKWESALVAFARWLVRARPSSARS